jgi:hypothetical protein
VIERRSKVKDETRDPKETDICKISRYKETSASEHRVRHTHLRHIPHSRISLVQHIGRIPGPRNQILEMVLQGLRIARLVDSFQYIEDNAGVAVAVYVDFLMVGDLADLAAGRLVILYGGRLGGGRLVTWRRRMRWAARW